jgi:xanthine/uracil/vitamin C permease (AzgA family)
VLLKVFRGKVNEVSWVMWLFAILLMLAKVLQALNI